MSTTDLILSDWVSPGVLESETELAESFQLGRPFRHVVIDNFLTTQFCAKLREQFPSFDETHAINENKQVGGKSTREKVRALGEAFLQADDLMKSPQFLDLVGRITGVEDLNYDPHYYGGGTHENREGQDLDPHIDFNFHPVSNQHRRLNLIIYLNPEWDDSWGGSLQLHRDPYLQPSDDEIVTVTPLMNRCVIFETTENSWHGFERISLPESKQNLSRKSFAVYFYTAQRPGEETADEHSTVYVERHLPDRFAPGMILDEGSLHELRELLFRRDQHLKRLYRDIQNLNGRINCHRKGQNSGDASTGGSTYKDPEDLPTAIKMIKNLRWRIDDLESSTSWRLTAPLRVFKRLIKGQS